MRWRRWRHIRNTAPATDPSIVPLKGGVDPGIYSPAKAGTFGEFLDDVLAGSVSIVSR